MVTNTSYNGVNSGIQVTENYGAITANLSQPETLLDQACLRDLRTTNPCDDKERIKKTNGGLLDGSYRWILENETFRKWQNNQSNRLLWIRGDPGKGKTMLLCGIIEELTRSHKDSATISFFFCQANDMRINTATSVLRGLIYLLIEKNVSLLRYVRARYDSAGKDLFEDINAWSALVSIFTQILEDSSLKSIYFVIDALDECRDGLQDLLDLIVEKSTTHQEIRWVVSSRNEYEITECLDSATHVAPISLEMNKESVSEAVNAFIQHKVDSLAKKKRYDEQITAAVKRHLLTNSQGTFLWAALVWKNLDQTPRRHATRKLEMFPPGLDALYRRMMGQVRDSEDAELCKQILGTVTAVFRPVTLSELSSLLSGQGDAVDDLDTLYEIIGICGSFLTLRESTVMFVHQSAKDFLIREASTEIFPKGLDSEHHTIFSECLNVISDKLRRDIFDLKLPGFPIKDIKEPSPNPLAPAEYACVYWVDHLDGCKYNAITRSKNREMLDGFLQRDYLHWLEALSILGSLSDGIRAMKRLERVFLEESESDDLLERAQDASRFVQYHRTGIENSPLQVYNSSLVFSPSKSLIRMAFQEEKPDWILNSPLVEENWSACLQTLEGHSNDVNSIVWSPDGSRLASGSQDTTIRIWNPVTGESVSTLEGHSNSVDSIAWSPDGRRLASGSSDKTVRIWDPDTGQSVSTLEGHGDSVRSIAWSPDGSRLASVSRDKIIGIWDSITNWRMSTLEGHSDSVISVAWSPDGTRLASGSDDMTLGIWDPFSGQRVLTLQGCCDSVVAIAWSPDGCRLASASSSDKTIRIWDPVTGQNVSTLEGHRNLVVSISWSPDGSRLASGSHDRTVQLWDAVSCQRVFTLKGHRGSITSIVWSPNGDRLASGCWDNTVSIWNPVTGRKLSTLEGHGGSVFSVAWSPDGLLLASASRDQTARIWDPASAQGISTFESHSDSIISIAWSPDGSRLASSSNDHTVRIWNPTTGQSVSTLKGHSGSIYSIAWLPNGSRLASASRDKTVRIWDPATCQCVLALKGHRNVVESIAWSPDGSRLASASWDTTIRIWNPVTGQNMSTLVGHSGLVLSISWSPDGTRLASGSWDNTIRIWDPVIGQSMFTLECHSLPVISIAWLPDGSLLASTSGDKTFRIADPAICQSVPIIPINSISSLGLHQAGYNTLDTNAGTLSANSKGSVTPLPDYFIPSSKQYAYGLSNESSWITYNAHKLLWLPSEYRPTNSRSFAIYANTIAIVCSFNRIIFLELQTPCPIPSL